ncbi:AraC family ligand binding domain-containing protein [Pseudomonas sp. NPDC078700]|uniref:AraC family transcriptional regulator n=1 Tax=Pseudomonas sp. NPDC078700 TaxID=3364424 RepID=UPI0037C7076F
MDKRNWLELSQDAETGIESIRAHFQGHAYDPHWHDSFLLGVTEQGVQQFNCRRVRHVSTPGKVIMLEPGDIHDGHAPTDEGFTYSMLYIDPHWLERELHALFEHVPANSQLGFCATLSQDAGLSMAINQAFRGLHEADLRIVRQNGIDQLLDALTNHLDWRKRQDRDPRLPLVAQRARDYLHGNFAEDIGLDDLAQACSVDRFRLTRAFKAAFGLAPHAYLIQLRLAKARQLLAKGELPAQVATTLGFADQSHLGRWFRRAYQLTPADYRKRCSNLPD